MLRRAGLAQQPQFVAPLNTGHDLAGICTACVYPVGNFFLDAVSGTLSTQANAANPTKITYRSAVDVTGRPDTTARCIESTATTSGQFWPRQASRLDKQTVAGTVLYFGGTSHATNTQVNLFGSTEYLTVGTGVSAGIDDNAFIRPGAVTLGYLGAGASVSSPTPNVLTASPRNKLIFAGAAWDGVNHYFYSSGLTLRREQVAGAAGPAANTGRRLTALRTEFGNGDVGAFLALGLAFSRVLTLREYSSLWLNPWGLLAPAPRRIWQHGQSVLPGICLQADGSWLHKPAPGGADKKIYLTGAGGYVAKASPGVGDKLVALVAGQWLAS